MIYHVLSVGPSKLLNEALTLLAGRATWVRVRAEETVV